MERRMVARSRVLAIGVVAAGIAACVDVPQEVRQTFAPAGPGETSYYRRRPDAPPPDGFVKPVAPDAGAPVATPAPTSSTATAVPLDAGAE
jgi:hypothetical protein